MLRFNVPLEIVKSPKPLKSTARTTLALDLAMVKSSNPGEVPLIVD